MKRLSLEGPKRLEHVSRAKSGRPRGKIGGPQKLKVDWDDEDEYEDERERRKSGGSEEGRKVKMVAGKERVKPWRKYLERTRIAKEQGRIHGYLSRVR